MTALGVFTGESWYAALARCVALRYKSSIQTFPASRFIQRAKPLVAQLQRT